MTRFCPAERWLRVRMRTKLGHLVPLTPEKGVRVFACEQDLGELEARERRLRVRMRTNLGSRKLQKGARVFACEQNLGLLEASERACVFACEQDLGELEARERCSRVRMRTRPWGAGSPRKVLACSHANKTRSSCSVDPRKRCSRVRMRTRPRGAGSSRKAVACSHANKNLGWLFCLNGIFFSQPPPFLW